EGVTVLLIIVVATVVLAKIIGGSAPGNQSFTLKVFSPPSGVSVGDVFKGAVFGFLSFAGFEAASTLGEETKEPKRAIPRAILGTSALGSVRSQTGEPVRALAVITLAAAAIILICRLFFTDTAFDIFVWSGVIGTLILLVAYVLATLGAMRMLWFRGRARVAQWQMIIPIAALLVLLATLYYNVDPDAAKATRWNYYTAGAW